MTDLTIEKWEPIALWLDEIGPFRQGIESFFFTDDSRGDGQGNPSNLYMLLAKNARGKTTALEAIYGLLGLLNQPPVGRFAQVANRERAQFDVRTTVLRNGQRETVLLSLWTGSNTPLHNWTDKELADYADVSEWAKLGLVFNGTGQATIGSDDFGADFMRALAAERGEQPTALEGFSQSLPTVLFFPADRTIVAPSEQRAVVRPTNFAYQPAQRFGSDGPDWDSSIDNLLVWLEWLGDGRTKQLLEFLNRNVFTDGEHKAIREPRRGELLTYVSTRTGDHPLAQLSQGERALLQFYGRTLAHMTRNTLILIDEVDNHLHPRWMQRMMAALKSLIREEQRSVSVIFTTHNLELMETFRHDVPEEGLVKGGKVVLDEMRSERSESKGREIVRDKATDKATETGEDEENA